MRVAETLALIYFVLVAGSALALCRRRPRWGVSAGWALAGALVAATAGLLPAIAWSGHRSPVDLRDWWLLLALPLAYWAPAGLTVRANERLEHWLQAVDDRLGLGGLDPSKHSLLELAYLMVYPMVPAGLLAVMGHDPALAPAFWTALLAAVLPCYGLLPLLSTRPPRALLLPVQTRLATSTPFRRANVTFLAAFANPWNTLPSGHAAGAVAVASMVWRSGSPLAPVFMALALGVALGTVRGRYHYVVDTVLGVALGVVAAAVA